MKDVVALDKIDVQSFTTRATFRGYRVIVPALATEVDSTRQTKQMSGISRQYLRYKRIIVLLVTASRPTDSHHDAYNARNACSYRAVTLACCC